MGSKFGIDTSPEEVKAEARGLAGVGSDLEDTAHAGQAEEARLLADPAIFGDDEFGASFRPQYQGMRHVLADGAAAGEWAKQIGHSVQVAMDEAARAESENTRSVRNA